MQIFNEEGQKRKIVLILDRQEVKDLMEALETAIKVRKGKLRWKKMMEDLSNRAYVW
jgi:hypothetical protein